MTRVVSLVPSSTETLLAIGADVVACTRFCEQPGLVHVGGTKNPNIDAIVALRPDLVVMDREENRIEDHGALIEHGLSVFVSDVRSVADALVVVDELAAAAGMDPGACEPIPARFDGDRRLAFVPIWRRPWMSMNAQTYGASVLDHLGIHLVTASSPDAYPTVDLDDIATAGPDLVLVPSEPYEFTDAHLDELRDLLPTAIVVRVDGQDLFWWGIRTPAALHRLADLLRAVQ